MAKKQFDWSEIYEETVSLGSTVEHRIYQDPAAKESLMEIVSVLQRLAAIVSDHVYPQ